MRAAVHPHVRGEQAALIYCSSKLIGSSPRTWGTGCRICPPSGGSRFIPTYVGNRDEFHSPPWRLPVHPHVRGEQRASHRATSAAAGSSPRTWGTGWLNRSTLRARRFIPTYVGNSATARGRAPRPPVHPHVRGEQELDEAAALFSAGSSPRTWGTGPAIPASTPRSRFIPTYVGNRHSGAHETIWNAVHPHVRGEQADRLKGNTGKGGSSPRTWGTAVAPAQHRRQSRFIPTYVGNSQESDPPAANHPVHPHVRGEQAIVTVFMTATPGSSPRTWGTGHRQGARDGRRRFIPTYVGNRLCWLRQQSRPAVHPHVRGEQLKGHETRAIKAGSSPRTWGTELRTRLDECSPRFIPTYVGNRPRALATRINRTVHPHVRGEQVRIHGHAVQLGGSSPRTWGTGFLEPVVKSAYLRCQTPHQEERWFSRCLQWFKTHQLQAIKIDWFTPVFAASGKIKSLISWGFPGDDGIAIFDAAAHLFPNALPGAQRIISNIHTSPEFQQPRRQSPPQPRWYIFNHDDHHRPKPFRQLQALPHLQRVLVWAFLQPAILLQFAE